MHIFISAYVLLALASWSALAAPLSGSERDNKNVAAHKHASSSSTLMGRQGLPLTPGLPPPGLPPPGLGMTDPMFIIPTSDGPDSNGPSGDSTMDCDSKPKSHKDDSKTHDDKNSTPTADPSSYQGPTATTTGPTPAIARRRFPRPMRRDKNDSPSIFERDEADSGNPITVGDIVKSYLNQRAAARKRAPSPRTTRNFK